MKILIALDSYKGTLRAAEACSLVAATIKKSRPDIDVVLKPMADGGEGTAEAMIAAKKGTWISQTVNGPLPGMMVNAGFAWFENDRQALVEMASASGIELLAKHQLNPMKTTTFGTGQLIQAAAEYGAKKILLAVGGSATVDGGVGAAMALGWRFLDTDGQAILPIGADLANICHIIKPDHLDLPPIEVLCDVDNPLCGQNGAAVVYGPQKGATPQMVKQLENSLNYLSALVKSQCARDIRDVPGSGAAGGLAAGALVFMEAKLVSGIETIIQESDLPREMKDADWIITGEGSFDHQSLMGKVVSGITKIARANSVKVAVIAGQVGVAQDEYTKFGVEIAISCKTSEMTVEDAIADCRGLLKTAAQKFIYSLDKTD